MNKISDCPPPLVAADRDVRDLDGFMLNVERLLASELVAVGTPEECWAAFMLWCRSWKQLPGGSLPNNERVLASFSGADKRWPKVREMAMHGFVLCSDGRFYHRVLCEEVERAYKAKCAHKTRRETDQKRLAEWRARQKETQSETPPIGVDATHDETRFNGRFETSFVAEGTVQGQGQGQYRDSKKEENTHPSRASACGGDAPKDRQGLVSLKNFEPSPAARQWACLKGYSGERLEEEAERFRNHYLSDDRMFADPDAKFKNWLIDDLRKGRLGRNGHASPEVPASPAEIEENEAKKLRMIAEIKARWGLPRSPDGRLSDFAWALGWRDFCERGSWDSQWGQEPARPEPKRERLRG